MLERRQGNTLGQCNDALGRVLDEVGSGEPTDLRKGVSSLTKTTKLRLKAKASRWSRRKKLRVRGHGRQVR